MRQSRVAEALLTLAAVAATIAWLMSPSAPKSTLSPREMPLAGWLAAHPRVGQRTLLAEWILVRFEDLPRQDADEESWRERRQGLGRDFREFRAAWQERGLDAQFLSALDAAFRQFGSENRVQRDYGREYVTEARTMLQTGSLR